MISSTAYTAIAGYSTAHNHSKGTLSLALDLYYQNFQAARAAKNSPSAAQIEQVLLTPTSLTSLFDQAKKSFADEARKQAFPERVRGGFGSAVGAIVIGIISNFIFVLLSLGIYIVAKDTAGQALQSLAVTPEVVDTTKK